MIEKWSPDAVCFFSESEWLFCIYLFFDFSSALIWIRIHALNNKNLRIFNIREEGGWEEIVSW